MKKLALLFLTIIFAACTSQKTYQVGVSQCSDDDWRALLNIEIMREARFQGDMQVEVVSADDDSRRQVEDIERFIREKKDIIIVAPNVATDVQPAIEKAYDSGIPVILIDRRTQSRKYTAFIGADNRAIGRQIGRYIRQQGQRQGEIVELCGLEGSSPAIERHDGFIAQNPSETSNVTTAHADWNKEDAERVMDSLLAVMPHIDYVFAQNDRMAAGALEAIKRAGRTEEIKVVGVDALTTPGGGVDMVLEGRLLATHTYPTGGSEAIQLAHKILTGEPYDREIVLPSALVDSANARVMHLQYLTMKGLDDKYEKLESLTDRQLAQLNTQRWIMGGAVVIVLLIALLCHTYYKLYREKTEAGEMLMAQIKTLVEMQNIAPAAPIAPEPEEEAEDTTEEAAEQTATEEPAAAEGDKALTGFLAEIEKIIDSRMGDADLSVGDIADELGISRVQLYRRVKAISETGLTDIIRRARMERARQLLATGRKSVSEVAYDVGFSSPSYFTKCYKEHWGESPSCRRV